jgi:hypothetical protein
MIANVKRHGVSLLTACLLVIATGVAVTSLPSAQAQELHPGGRAARIHSYTFRGNVVDSQVLIAECPGTHGFIITDIFVYSHAGTGATLTLSMSEDDPVFYADMSNDPAEALQIHFESGIPIPAGEVIQCTIGQYGLLNITVTGYTY